MTRGAPFFEKLDGWLSLMKGIGKNLLADGKSETKTLYLYKTGCLWVKF